MIPVASARMYSWCPTLTAAWRRLLEWVAAHSGGAVKVLELADPYPLEDLWARDDLGCVFMCGYPWAMRAHRRGAERPTGGLTGGRRGGARAADRGAARRPHGAGAGAYARRAPRLTVRPRGSRGVRGDARASATGGGGRVPPARVTRRHDSRRLTTLRRPPT